MYFDLTAAFNQHHPTAALASGQAVVFYRIAIMSKDGAWVIREPADACDRVRSVLRAHGARYRLSAPLEVRWLRGGWSSISSSSTIAGGACGATSSAGRPVCPPR